MHATEHEAQLTKDMNNATEKLKLLSESEGTNMDEDEGNDNDEFDDAMDNDEHSEMDT